MNNLSIKQIVKNSFIWPTVGAFLGGIATLYAFIALLQWFGFSGWSWEYYRYMALYLLFFNGYRNGRITYQNLKENNLYSLTSNQATLICASFLAVYFVFSYALMRATRAGAQTSFFYALFMPIILVYSMWQQERELRKKSA